jgi:hypothetical protein
MKSKSTLSTSSTVTDSRFQQLSILGEQTEKNREKELESLADQVLRVENNKRLTDWKNEFIF